MKVSRHFLSELKVLRNGHRLRLGHLAIEQAKAQGQQGQLTPLGSKGHASLEQDERGCCVSHISVPLGERWEGFFILAWYPEFVDGAGASPLTGVVSAGFPAQGPR